jgi:hypothetical protein
MNYKLDIELEVIDTNDVVYDCSWDRHHIHHHHAPTRLEKVLARKKLLHELELTLNNNKSLQITPFSC